ncbi:cytochrome P450 [Zalerion maritima]|uniref:Cytochrome P450 n=1 Tax=Zalerion maritima TaxID=339359 RepID=A0AAD5RNN2_9PEZI|nr:cytochrome P450 [Zalerion maritima]
MDNIVLVVCYVLLPGVLISALRSFFSSHSLLPKSKTVSPPPSPKLTGLDGTDPVPETYPGKFPGPKQYPIVGRVHDLPRFNMWRKLKEWADEFGPIYQTSMVGQKFIVISDENIARELLVRRGNKYAGRPQIRALINHKAGPVYSALMDRHDIWKFQRKWVHAAMSASHKEHFHGHIEREVSRYLATLLLDPDKFHQNTRELTGRVMSTLAYDDATQGPAKGHSAIKTLTQMSVSGPIVNTMSPLWHLGDLIHYNPWRNYEVDRETNQRKWWLELFMTAKKRYQAGTLPEDTWTYRYFEQLQANGNQSLEQSCEDVDSVSCMLGFQCLVGVVTISGPLQFFLMAMSKNRDWQKKAQEEVDRVCGDRMPTREDFPNLPTVRACIKETLRWRSGVPLGVPHQCEEDDEFKGVKIEKGTIILACEWNINRVKTNYPDPETYNPARYLSPEYPTYQEPLSRYPNFREGVGMHTFGWGRRTCLGQNMVDDEMFCAAAGVLWAFDMDRKRCQATGKVVEFDDQATNSNVILEPLPFPMEIKPRSDKRAALVLENYGKVRDGLKV